LERERRKVVIYGAQDLFFLAKIEAIARRLGSKSLQINGLEPLKETVIGNLGALIVCDLKACVSELGEICALSNESGSKVLGYYSHSDSVTREKAEAAGVNYIAPKSALERKLENLLVFQIKN
jgi:hypothetical protein